MLMVLAYTWDVLVLIVVIVRLLQCHFVACMSVQDLTCKPPTYLLVLKDALNLLNFS